MVEETFFYLFNLAVVNAHILHAKTSKKKMLLHIFYESHHVLVWKFKYKVILAVQHADL